MAIQIIDFQEDAMPKAADIKATLATLTKLDGRTPETAGDAFANVFATLDSTAKTGIFTGSFQGESAWEIHSGGDELVQVIDGATTLTVINPDGSDTVLEMTAGMVTIVPQGCWHKFVAPAGVSVMTMTPTVPPTDHSTKDRPV